MTDEQNLGLLIILLQDRKVRAAARRAVMPWEPNGSPVSSVGRSRRTLDGTLVSRVDPSLGGYTDPGKLGYGWSVQIGSRVDYGVEASMTGAEDAADKALADLTPNGQWIIVDDDVIETVEVPLSEIRSVRPDGTERC